MARQPILTPTELSAFLDEIFPQVRGEFAIEAVGPMTAQVRQIISDKHLRPGGTISGPTMFQIADCAFYVAVLAMIGREALTVTTSLTINFLRKPPPSDLIAEARILKLGKLLATGDVAIQSVETGEIVAHATTSYAIPPKA